MQESNQLISLVAWIFVPALATSLLLKVLYMIHPRGAPTDALKAQRNYRLAFSLIVLTYLTTELYMSAFNNTGKDISYYTRLGVESGDQFQARDMKSAYRKLSLRFHPDKDSSTHAADEYKLIRDAYETLSNPLKRQLYDAFGSVECQHCKTYVEWFYAGLARQSGFYIGVGILFGVQSVIGYFKSSKKTPPTSQYELSMFWRVLALCALGVYELGYVTNAFELQWTPRSTNTVHQHVAFLRQLFLSSLMAMGQLGPVWGKLMHDTLRSTPALAHTMTISQLVQQLSAVVEIAAKETEVHSKVATAAFVNDEQSQVLIRRRMEKLVKELELNATSSDAMKKE